VEGLLAAKEIDSSRSDRHCQGVTSTDHEVLAYQMWAVAEDDM